MKKVKYNAPYGILVKLKKKKKDDVYYSILRG